MQKLLNHKPVFVVTKNFIRFFITIFWKKKKWNKNCRNGNFSSNAKIDKNQKNVMMLIIVLNSANFSTMSIWKMPEIIFDYESKSINWMSISKWIWYQLPSKLVHDSIADWLEIEKNHFSSKSRDNLSERFTEYFIIRGNKRLIRNVRQMHLFVESLKRRRLTIKSTFSRWNSKTINLMNIFNSSQYIVCIYLCWKKKNEAKIKQISCMPE